MNSFLYANLGAVFIIEMIFGTVGAFLLAMGAKRHMLFPFYIGLQAYIADQFLNFGIFSFNEFILYSLVIDIAALLLCMFCIIIKDDFLSRLELFTIVGHIILNYFLFIDFSLPFAFSIYMLIVSGIIFTASVLLKVAKRRKF